MNSIHLICLGVQDLTVSRQFYQALGFQAPNLEMLRQSSFSIILGPSWNCFRTLHY